MLRIGPRLGDTEGEDETKGPWLKKDLKRPETVLLRS